MFMPQLCAARSSQGADEADGEVGAEVDVAASSGAEPVATLKLGGEHTLEVHEIEPGDFLFVESRATGEAELDSAVLQRQSLAELHRSLLPKSPVPERVLQASERQRSAREQLRAADLAAAPASGRVAKLEASEALGAGNAVHTRGAIWEAKHCGFVGERTGWVEGPVGVDVALCKQNMGSGQWGHLSNVHAAQAFVETFEGKVTVTISHNFGDGAVEDKRVTVSAGHTTRFWRWKRSDDFNMHIDVSDVSSNDEFSYSLFGSGSTDREVLDCYDEGWHCGIGVQVQE
jgi:hypothetical protein